jgi:hypothetical protein
MKRKMGERPKKKHYKKSKTSAGTGAAPNPAADAIRYLDAWCERESGAWKFAKKSQVYLLRHAYDSAVLPSAHFQKLVRYVAGLPEGPARAKTIEQARALHADARSVLGKVAAGSGGDSEAAAAPGDGALDESHLEDVRRRASQILSAFND